MEDKETRDLRCVMCGYRWQWRDTGKGEEGPRKCPNHNCRSVRWRDGKDGRSGRGGKGQGRWGEKLQYVED